MKRDPEKDPKIIGSAPGAADADVGTAAEVDAIMRKFDRESNTRVWEGVPKIIVNCVTVLFALFCIYVTLFANFMEQIRLSSFLGLVVLIGFLTYPAKKGKVRVNYMPWYDVVLMVLGAGAFLFYTFNAQTVVKLNMRITKDMFYIVTGAVGMLVLAELCRRSVGLPILCVAGVFMIYTLVTLWNKGGIPLVVYKLFYGDSGVLSTPINVCSKYIVVFIIFGAFLERTGISDFFISLANSLCGRFAGGPAKVAVVSSALCGMVSGSSVGNTVTTGSVTIPMMKKTGYKPEFAGAVEAAASTGGQIMPPIMGAAAFLMAEYMDLPYAEVAVKAILPAILYFTGIFIAVHLEAKKLGLHGISRSELPKWGYLAKNIYLILPLILLVWLVSSGAKTMAFSAALSILAAFVIGFVHKLLENIRVMGVKKAIMSTIKSTILSAIDALAAGAKGAITVAVACAMAGIIAGCITVTGLASILINAIVQLAGNATIVGLVLTMICCIVLGMGVPTTANYCIMASTCAPILIQLGFPAVAAHFFVFYFGIVADITPPVALAAYAGSAIAKSNPMKTGINATKLAIAAFIVPYIFAYNPSMLFVGDVAWYDVIIISITALLGLFGIAAALNGYLYRKIPVILRIALIAGGLGMMIPGLASDLIGLAVVAAVVAFQYFSNKKQTASAA